MKIETIKYSDGIYKGEVQNEQPHGKGKLTIYEGKIPISKYIGEFKKGERDGKGISYTFNIDLSESKTPSIKFAEQISYKGEFKGGHWHGVGTFVDYGEDLYYLGKSFDKTRVKDDQIIATVSGNWNNGLHEGEGKIVVYYSKPGEKQKIMKTYEGIFKGGKLIKPELTEKEKIDETLEVRIFDDLHETGSMLSKQERENIEKNLDILGVTNEWKNELDNIKEELSSYDKEELKEKMTSGEIEIIEVIDKITKKNTSLNSKNYTLTKTKITSGLQCHKKLWFDFHGEPIKKDNFVFHVGNRFGEIVRRNYGEGLDLSDNFDIRDAVDQTKKAINSDNINVIYEGAFIYLDTLVRTDVLIRRKIGWELLEAKSSTKLKDEHIPDVAIQSFIVKSCGVNLSSIKLIHINKEFTYKGDKNYNNLIKENEITGEVILKEKEVINYIKKLKPLADKNSSSPNISMGEHCNKPYSCDYQDRCKSLLPKSNITSYEILPYIKKDKNLIKYMKEKGTKDLQKVPAKFFKDRSDYAPDYHKIIQDAHKNNNSWISKDLKNVFKDFSFPFYFIDFETVNQGVPIIKGTQPYYPLPFQWSVHKWESIDKEIKLNDAESFIDFESQNIEREFIKSLLKSVGETGTIFAHSASTEKSVLKRLKDKDNCSDLAEKIEKLINRVADTLNLVKKHFYSPLMNGDYGIKNIIMSKSIPSDISYNEKDNIGSGTDAQLAWFIYTKKNTSKKDKQKQIDLLIKYCSKDTLAMYHLLKYLINSSKK